MPRLRVVGSRKLIKILKSIGFELDHSTGSHFIFYNPETKKRAVVPYYAKDLPRGTVASILREIGIGREKFESFLRRKKK